MCRRAWTRGDQSAFDQLLPVNYGELPWQARCYLRRQSFEYTAQGTASDDDPDKYRLVVIK
jgi:hypothetical protein